MSQNIRAAPCASALHGNIVKVAGSVFANIVASATIDIWNQATANNIVKGRVYIENNLNY
jgi:hypothetical protein